MIFAFLFTVVVGVCAVALIGLEDSHYRVTRLMEEMDFQTAARAEQPAKEPNLTAPDVEFTRSLLALSKVDSQVPCDSPKHERGEFSSSASIPPDRLRSHVQAL